MRAKVSDAKWIRVSLPDTVLEAQVIGSGEPVVLIQTALTGDEFLPLAAQLHPATGYQVILYHRRGYGSSNPVTGPGSIERDAMDCKHLLSALGVEKAHVFGGSYSAAVALQLAAMVPHRVHTLCLAEPPPVHTSKADEFRTTCAELTDYYRRHGTVAAVDHFLTRLMGAAWRTEIEQILPGGAGQVERDSRTFFATDIPALLGWRFSAEEVERVTQPVLYVGGTESGPWFAEVRELILGWFPRAQQAMLAGADHSLALTHAPQLASALAAFMGEHPMGSRPPTAGRP